jgi:hypothetical protein
MKPAIKAWPKGALGLVAVFASGAVVGWWACYLHVFFTGGGERTFLVSASPHGASRVRLVDVPAGLVDFQFEVRLQRAGEAGEVTLFRSPDTMSDPTYRVVWARDGSKFVVARNWGVGGDSLLLMYDLPKRKLWSNFSQDDGHPSFTIDDVRAVEWTQFPSIQPADGSPAAGDSEDREE